MSRLPLRLHDVRLAFRAIGDCRDVGDHTGQWQELAMGALIRLVGAVAVTGGEGRWPRPRQLPVQVSMFGIHTDPVFRSLQGKSTRLETVRRAELVPDREWYRASTFVD
ncbi:MAG: hypothetical protein AB7N65_14015 [Vicinamibacterales bacterium]